MINDAEFPRSVLRSPCVFLHISLHYLLISRLNAFRFSIKLYILFLYVLLRLEQHTERNKKITTYSCVYQQTEIESVSILI